MRQKKQLFIMILFAAVCLFASDVSAADNWQWYDCTIVKLGVGGARYEFQLSGTVMNNGSPTTLGGWYEIHPDSAQLQKEVLAVILTAVSLDKHVEVLLIPGTTKSIYAIYLKI